MSVLECMCILWFEVCLSKSRKRSYRYRVKWLAVSPLLTLKEVMQTRQCRMTCKGLLTYLGVEVIVLHTFKVPISSKFLFSYLILYITQWTFAKEKCDLNKMQSFLEVIKTFKFAAILVHHSYQSSPHLKWVVTYIKEDVASGLTFLASFTSVN